MGLFGKKKEDKVQETCDCGGACASPAEAEKTTASDIKVLGSGCKKCNDLEASVKAALAELGKDTTVEHVRDFGEIAAYGVMTTPALVVKGKVLSSGKVLKTAEAKKLLETAL